MVCVCADNGRHATISNREIFDHYEYYPLRQRLPKNLLERQSVSV